MAVEVVRFEGDRSETKGRIGAITIMACDSVALSAEAIASKLSLGGSNWLQTPPACFGNAVREAEGRFAAKTKTSTA